MIQLSWNDSYIIDLAKPPTIHLQFTVSFEYYNNICMQICPTIAFTISTCGCTDTLWILIIQDMVGVDALMEYHSWIGLKFTRLIWIDLSNKSGLTGWKSICKQQVKWNSKCCTSNLQHICIKNWEIFLVGEGLL